MRSHVQKYLGDEVEIPEVLLSKSVEPNDGLGQNGEPQ
jgi:hypothetical protein